MSQTLGETKRKYVFLCQGTLPKKEMTGVALYLVRLAGMSPARRRRIDRYPYRGGGGQGYTLYQPLMESYLMIDVYEDLQETEILLSTCKPERVDTTRLIRAMECLIGPTTFVGKI